MASQDSDSERLKGNVKCFLLTRIVKLKLERPQHGLLLNVTSIQLLGSDLKQHSLGFLFFMVAGSAPGNHREAMKQVLH